MRARGARRVHASQPNARPCPQGSTALLGTSAAYPPNVRVTRQAAARQRQLEQQLLKEQMQQPGADSMDVEPTGPVLDPTHRADPQECNHYVNEIYAYLRELECVHRVSPHFMQASLASRVARRLVARVSPPPVRLTAAPQRAAGALELARTPSRLAGPGCFAPAPAKVHGQGTDGPPPLRRLPHRTSATSTPRCERS